MAPRGGGSIQTRGASTAAERWRKCSAEGRGRVSVCYPLGERGSSSEWHSEFMTAGPFSRHTSGVTDGLCSADLSRRLKTCEGFSTRILETNFAPFDFCRCPRLEGFQRWERPRRPGSQGLMEIATSLECAERRVSARNHHTAACLKMLNDINIEDRLRTDASSLDVLIGEFTFFSFLRQCGILKLLHGSGLWSEYDRTGQYSGLGKCELDSSLFLSNRQPR